MPIKSVKMKILVPKPKSVPCSPRTDRQTDRRTDTKVTTVGTLSGFQEFFLQPIIKDRPNTILRYLYIGIHVEMSVSYVKCK